MRRIVCTRMRCTNKRTPLNQSQNTGDITQDELKMLREMQSAVRDAFIRAKAKGVKDPVYHYLNLDRNRFSDWSIHQKLQKEDPGYRPGTLYEASELAKMKDSKPFKRLIKRAETQVEGFKWASWKPE